MSDSNELSRIYISRVNTTESYVPRVLMDLNDGHKVELSALGNAISHACYLVMELKRYGDYKFTSAINVNTKPPSISIIVERIGSPK